jgi:hypothetical protein
MYESSTHSIFLAFLGPFSEFFALWLRTKEPIVGLHPPLLPSIGTQQLEQRLAKCAAQSMCISLSPLHALRFQ